MRTKKVSMIVPCYNASDWLRQCYLSLVNQTIGIENIELIFVDDASTDGGKTWEMLLSFEQEFPESIIVIQSEKNMRQGGARNMAMQYATGEYIGFCDADDWLDESALEKVYSYAKKTDADIVQFSHYYYIDEKDIRPDISQDKITDSFIKIHTVEERKQFLMWQVVTLGCWNKLYKHSLIMQTGVQFAEHVIYEEPLFTYPLLFEVRRVAFIKDYLYYYRYNINGTMLSDMNNMKTLTDHISVQIQLYELMLKKPYYLNYKDEIDLHFIHSYLYETFSFAKKRNFADAYIIFQHLAGTLCQHYPDLLENSYIKTGACSMQRQILQLAMKNAGRTEFEEFYKNCIH